MAARLRSQRLLNVRRLGGLPRSSRFWFFMAMKASRHTSQWVMDCSRQRRRACLSFRCLPKVFDPQPGQPHEVSQHDGDGVGDQDPIPAGDGYRSDDERAEEDGLQHHETLRQEPPEEQSQNQKTASQHHELVYPIAHAPGWPLGHLGGNAN